MRRVLAPILFDDDEAESPKLPAPRRWPRQSAPQRPNSRPDGQPVHSLRTLLADLATLARNVVSFGKAGELAMFTKPTKIQQRAFDLLGVETYECSQCSAIEIERCQ